MALPTSQDSDAAWPSPSRARPDESWPAPPSSPRPQPRPRRVPQPRQAADQTWSVSTPDPRRREPPAPRPPADTWFDDDVVPVDSRPPGPGAVVIPAPAPGPAAAPSPAPPVKPRSQPAPAPRRAAPAAAQRNPRPRTSARPVRRNPSTDWSRVAPVYDVDGPRIRYGLAWFGVALVAVTASPWSAALVYAAAAGLAARQIVKAWRGVQWQADLAAGLAAAPVLATAVSQGAGVALLAVAMVTAAFAGLQAPTAGLRGSAGRIAA
ncbi:MAG TPA: hypothetical protein VGJ86_16875, partial [Acidimicrobiales bacterium]